MVNEVTQEKANIISSMEQHLREKILHNDADKLWENIYIKHQIDARNNGAVFSVKDHIRAMVYSMLSAGAAWNRIADSVDIATGRIMDVDKIFDDYVPELLLRYSPEQLRDRLKEIRCASQFTLKQMKALINVNIKKLLEIEREYGTIDKYYQKFVQMDKTLITLVKNLSDKKSKDKMVQMGIALVCEYLRNVGYDLPKPDRHICRILGHDVLAFSDKPIATPLEVFHIIPEIAGRLNKSVAEVDYILWSYCAKGHGEICTVVRPRCDICVATKICIINNR